MNAIVFIRSPLFDIYKWRINDDICFHVITQCALPDTTHFSSFYRTDSIDKDSELIIWIENLISKYRIDFVICHSEYDLIRSAQLRDRLGIRGQNTQSALAYRDKAVMKSYCSQKMIKVANWQKVEQPENLRSAIQAVGFPCVIKPIAGGGSRNTYVAYDETEINHSSHQFPLLVEQFIEGKMFHVDGLVEGGKVIFSTVSFYTTSCLAWQKGVSLGSVVLESGSTLDSRMKQEACHVIAALPLVAQMAFHAEFFLTPDDDIVLCEIAARSGGALVPQAIEAAWGININECWLRQQQGEELSLMLPLTALRQSGWFLLPPKKGTLQRLPEIDPPFNWLSNFRFTARLGIRFNGADSSVSHIAAGVVSGQSSFEVEERIAILDRWLNQHTQWEV
ncbi:ATP-grasp domain-containing protein [Photorhabdus bodei]|uniref:ATP-grasp domain-containing protein n=1 Tax=Photorhabdus bodei TaxID=2029681 RepID=A0ABX0AVB8_9GAMM|nr:ATP-grasp domain-containing protein [Photorhabdus bodei]NDL01322.1 ATP-grasp domain-containing protein [Photorhabdus bodei]NDL05611.1 ATP-grasp domain-containing protein [Photorhabdus bodei]NDL09804.1 ATP-grasp domain-containing protein [Photorhabdus bodei]